MAQKGGDFKNWSGLPWPENLQRTEEITSLMTFVFWQAEVAILNSARREERSLNRDMFQERHANFRTSTDNTVHLRPLKGILKSG